MGNAAQGINLHAASKGRLERLLWSTRTYTSLLPPPRRIRIESKRENEIRGGPRNSLVEVNMPQADYFMGEEGRGMGEYLQRETRTRRIDGDNGMTKTPQEEVGCGRSRNV